MSAVRVLAGLVAGLVLSVSTAAADTFADILDAPLTGPLTQSLAQSVARATPVVSASPGLRFTLEPSGHAFQRDTTLFGQVYVERAATLGKRHLNVAITYEWVRFDEIDGEPLDALRDDVPIRDPSTGQLFTVPHFGVDLRTQVITTGITYGLTEALDVSATIPLLQSRFGLDIVVRDTGTGHRQRAHDRATAFGIGDVLLRAKQRLLRVDGWDLAAGLGLSIPSGNVDNFQGTDRWEIKPMLIVSSPEMGARRPFSLRAYANAGVQVPVDAADQGEGRFAIGVDVALGDRVTIGIAALGLESFSGVAPSGFFDVERGASGTTSQPILGLQDDRVSNYDFSIGGRVNLWRDTLIAFVNVLLPINDDGLRSAVIPVAGLEASW